MFAKQKLIAPDQRISPPLKTMAVLSGKIQTRDRVTAIVLSGGNIDVEMFASIQKE